MADPIFSPDGKWMWAGNEWIPAPPGMDSNVGVSNISDSVVMGNVSINDASSISSAVQSASQCRNCNSNNVSIIVCSSCGNQAYCSICKDEIVNNRFELSSDNDSELFSNFRKLCEERICNTCFNQKLANTWDSCQYCGLLAAEKSDSYLSCLKCHTVSCVKCSIKNNTSVGFGSNEHLVDILKLSIGSIGGKICRACFESVGPHPSMMCTQCNKIQKPSDIMFGKNCGICHMGNLGFL
tara:strand:+ start:113 stop:829 length:717 start_codon:yes stop_codon:yes gene_type:complete